MISEEIWPKFANYFVHNILTPDYMLTGVARRKIVFFSRSASLLNTLQTDY